MINKEPFLPYHFDGKRLALLPSVLYNQAVEAWMRKGTYISGLLEVISRGIYHYKIVLFIS